jgi:glycosyltransferase involved in cell wall biosynthesis
MGRLRARFTKGPDGLLPIPPNVRRPDMPTTSALAREIAAKKASGKFVIGQFGSIYPKKQSMLVLDIASELKRRGHQVHAVFIGSFVKAGDHLEERFWARAKVLGIADDVEVTGYVQSAADLFAAFDQIDAFVYDFAEGLSARRGSVLACLQSGRPVIVNEPADGHEFDHHRDYQTAIAQSMLRFVPLHATTNDFADALLAAVAEPPRDARIDFDACWDHAVAALNDFCRAKSAH